MLTSIAYMQLATQRVPSCYRLHLATCSGAGRTATGGLQPGLARILEPQKRLFKMEPLLIWKISEIKPRC